MKRFSALLLLLTVSAYAQVLEESSRPLGHEFREIMRSEQLPPGSFEGIGHFASVYYKDRKLCECSAGEVFVSPSGRFAVFANSQTGQVMLFVSKTEVVKPVAPAANALIEAVSWDETSYSATVRFSTAEGAANPPPVLPVSLPSND